MRVDLTTFGLDPPEKGKTGRAGQPEVPATGAGSPSGVDQTRFSFDQARVQAFATHVLAQPEVRSDRVSSLREAIGNGTYSIPASEVANALVRDLASGIQG